MVIRETEEQWLQAILSTDPTLHVTSDLAIEAPSCYSMPGNQTTLIHYLIIDEGADLAYTTETEVGKLRRVDLTQLCLLGFLVQHHPQWESGVTVVYRTSICLAENYFTSSEP